MSDIDARRATLSRTIGRSDDLTFYSRHGDWLGSACLLLGGMFVAGHCPVGNSVSVLIQITGPIALYFIEILLPQHLAALHTLVGIYEWLAHPLVHSHIEIAQNENR